MTGPPQQQHHTITLFDERQADALAAVLAERLRQERLKKEGKFSHTLRDQEMTHLACLACCTEELGEISERILHYEGFAESNARLTDLDALIRSEITQLTALCLAWLEGEW